jgi:hypothetical protein
LHHAICNILKDDSCNKNICHERVSCNCFIVGVVRGYIFIHNPNFLHLLLVVVTIGNMGMD